MASIIISGTNHATLHVQVFGRMVRVVALATSPEDANAYLAKHPSQGVISEFGNLIVISENADLGVKQ